VSDGRIAVLAQHGRGLSAQLWRSVRSGGLEAHSYIQEGEPTDSARADRSTNEDNCKLGRRTALHFDWPGALAGDP
jgi:hypothetical protein